MSVLLETAVPTFAVADVGATLRWYAEHFDFLSSAFPDHEPHAWGSLVRDGVEIMLLRVDGYEKPDLRPLRREGFWDAYIRVTGVRALYERVRDRVDVLHPPTERFYGFTEIGVRDPNGYILVFGEETHPEFTPEGDEG